MSELTLTLFGSFQAHLDDAPLVGFQSDKARALLAYLVIESHAPQRRDKLAGLLWPDFLDSAARGNLRHALANLRSLLDDKRNPKPFLLADRQTIQINPDATVNADVNLFSQIVGRIAADTTRNESAPNEAISAIEGAVSLYEGPFLDGFFLADCVDFEEWLTLTRERLHLEHNRLLQHLLDHYWNDGNLKKALIYARQKLAQNRLVEEDHMSVLHLLGLIGQRGAALQQYETCVHLLQSEFGVEPSEQVKTLHQKIQSGKLAPVPVTRLSPETSSGSEGEQFGNSEQIHAPKHNLPSSLTSFVGRTEALADIEELLMQNHVRLLTLEGPGGIGKTRLAIEIGRRVSQYFTDGVFLVELAPLSSSEQVVPAIAEVLGIKESQLHALEDEIIRRVDSRHVLLILDNFEHVIDAALAVSDLIEQASDVKVLFTSRIPLNLYGEFTYPLSALTFPSDENDGDISTLQDYSALQLLIERGGAAIPKLALNGADLRIASTICQRLDGLPLAIELTAARLKQLSLNQIHEQFVKMGSAGVINIKSKERNRPIRHKSLYDAVDWSYQLLESAEQTVLRRLAIFWGGCTYDAAVYVCRSEMAEDIDGSLELLAEYNLIRIKNPESAPRRIFMLETIRDYGVEQLRKQMEYDQVSQLHAEFFVQWVEDLYADEESPGAGSPRLNSTEIISAEYNNLHAVQRWTLDCKRMDLALRLVAR